MLESESPNVMAQVLAKWEPHRGLTTPPTEPIMLSVRESVTIYVENTWGPVIPYPPIDHADGAQNHGYHRVKGNPAAIAQIPETHEWPELRQILDFFNAPASPIETVGCEKGFFAVENRGDAKIQLGSYIDVIFTDVRLNEHPEKLLALAVHFATAVEGCQHWWAAVQFGLQRFRHIPGAQRPWGLMVRICNYGRSEEEARKFWGESIRRINVAAAKLPQTFGQ